LMFSLPVENWYRLIVWMVIGFMLYFTYGHKHSALRMREERLAAPGGSRRPPL
jgi:APA family basic amino acid/polyamine antiporter